jgi:hypothetical protein
MHFLPFTRWGAMAVQIQLILSIYIGSLKTKPSPKLLKFTAILTEMCLPSQLLIVGVYWTLLHDFVMHSIAPLNDPWVEFLFVYVHLWPGVAIFLNVVFSDLRFLPSHSRYMIPVGALYLVVNFVGSVVREEPVYPFLTWKDYKSPVIGVVLVGAGKVNYSAVCWIMGKVAAKR